MRQPLRRPSRFTTTIELPWALDAEVGASGEVTLRVTNGPARPGAKRLRRFETSVAADAHRRLMIAAAARGARVQVA